MTCATLAGSITSQACTSQPRRRKPAAITTLTASMAAENCVRLAANDRTAPLKRLRQSPSLHAEHCMAQRVRERWLARRGGARQRTRLMAGRGPSRRSQLLHAFGRGGLQLIGLLTVSTISWVGCAYVVTNARSNSLFQGVPGPAEVSNSAIENIKSYQRTKLASRHEQQAAAAEREEAAIESQLSQLPRSNLKDLLRDDDQEDRS